MSLVMKGAENLIRRGPLVILKEGGFNLKGDEVSFGREDQACARPRGSCILVAPQPDIYRTQLNDSCDFSCNHPRTPPIALPQWLNIEFIFSLSSQTYLFWMKSLNWWALESRENPKPTWWNSMCWPWRIIERTLVCRASLFHVKGS